jgi:hypothetical protein
MSCVRVYVHLQTDMRVHVLRCLYVQESIAQYLQNTSVDQGTHDACSCVYTVLPIVSNTKTQLLLPKL